MKDLIKQTNGKVGTVVRIVVGGALIVAAALIAKGAKNDGQEDYEVTFEPDPSEEYEEIVSEDHEIVE